MNIDIKIDDYFLDVSYNVYGTYIPSTLESPEEFPEIQILSIYDIEDGTEFVASEAIYEAIEQKIWDSILDNNSQIDFDPKPFYQ